MDLKWSYYLIITLYAVLIVLKYLNLKEEKSFTSENEKIASYIGYKNDFFTTVGWCCLVGTILINGAAVFVGKPMINDATLITIAVIGMALLSRRINILATGEGDILIGGMLIKKEQIKAVKVTHKNKGTWYRIDFVKTIAGYDGVAFKLKQNEQEFTQYTLQYR